MSEIVTNVRSMDVFCIENGHITDVQWTSVCCLGIISYFIFHIFRLLCCNVGSYLLLSRNRIDKSHPGCCGKDADSTGHPMDVRFTSNLCPHVRFTSVDISWT
ncbi:uncharacterized protein LOC112589144 [Harpegnathos saltator]|uniref:uncharacterized protein LOC112589144 n=1 Tax=Harpegnathos saltator TaxID=610380 RepID=UPI000DBED5CA|nr:uncharacterized protein LOC112589144 [Harpegnathos saltator]